MKQFYTSLQKGFTLIEVMIAMTILVFISLAIYQTTLTTYHLRAVLNQEGEFYNNIRFVTTLFQRDFQMLYSPITLINQLTPIAEADLLRSYSFWLPAVDNLGTRPSRLIGSENQISFVSLSHVRLYQEAQESEFSRITYRLERDDQDLENRGNMVLIRTESPDAFALDTSKDPLKQTYPLLRGIKRLHYEYRYLQDKVWKTSRSWDNDREETKNTYPDIIEMHLEVNGPKQMTFEGVFKFRPETPFNGIPSTF